MTETKTNPILRLMPSLTDVAFLLPLVFLFGGLNGVRTMLSDADTGWHVRTGEWILAHHRVPTQDMFSFTKPGEPWFAWEWLWDVCFAWIHGLWGLGGVVLASILVICFTSALLYRLILRVTRDENVAEENLENPVVAIALTGLAMAGASVHWIARPHLLTMLFVVVFLTILERVAKRDRQTFSRRELAGKSETDGPEKGFAWSPLWLLPPLTVVWTNLHGGFIVGIVLAGVYGAGRLVNAALERDGNVRAASAKSSLRYLAAAAGCALASLVNPYGYHLHTHIYAYLHDPFPMKYISEFQGTNFQWGASSFLEVMLVLAAGAVVWYGRRREFAQVLALAGCAHLALMIARNIPIFMIVAAPLVARPVVHWLRALSEAPLAGWLRAVFTTFEEIGRELAPMERPWRAHAFSAGMIALLGLAMNAPGAGLKLKPEYDPKAYPAAALAALQTPGETQGNFTHRTFTNDEWGDYLVYRLYPQGGKVFVDGRSDFYGDKLGEETMSVLNVKYDWEKTLARYGVDTILLPADSALAGAVKESRHWRVEYDDGLALVFRPAEGASGTNPQISAGTAGGYGGRDLPVAAATNVNPQDHEFKKRERE